MLAFDHLPWWWMLYIDDFIAQINKDMISPSRDLFHTDEIDL